MGYELMQNAHSPVPCMLDAFLITGHSGAGVIPQQPSWLYDIVIQCEQQAATGGQLLIALGMARRGNTPLMIHTYFKLSSCHPWGTETGNRACHAVLVIAPLPGRDSVTLP